jgi:hypothetical protein
LFFRVSSEQVGERGYEGRYEGKRNVGEGRVSKREVHVLPIVDKKYTYVGPPKALFFVTFGAQSNKNYESSAGKADEERDW